MSILSRLFGKKEPTVVAEPEKKGWSGDRCTGSGMDSTQLNFPVRREDGREYGKCPVCNRRVMPYKKTKKVPAHQYNENGVSFSGQWLGPNTSN